MLIFRDRVVCVRGVPRRVPVTNGYSTWIILKVKPEPVAGNPGFPTKSNGFNEYSGKPGYPDNPFSFTVTKGQGVPHADDSAYYDFMSKR